MHFLRLLALCWPGPQSAWDNHVLACNFAKYSSILFFFSDRLSNKPFWVWLLTTLPHLKYVVTLHTHTCTHPFNGPLSGTTQVSRYQKGKTNLDFTGARGSERQWYQLGHMQVCTSLQTDNHASTWLLKFFTGRMPFLPPNQQCHSTEGKVTLPCN